MAQIQAESDKEFYSTIETSYLKTKIKKEQASIQFNKSMIKASQKDINICEDILDQRQRKKDKETLKKGTMSPDKQMRLLEARIHNNIHGKNMTTRSQITLEKELVKLIEKNQNTPKQKRCGHGMYHTEGDMTQMVCSFCFQIEQNPGLDF